MYYSSRNSDPRFFTSSIIFPWLLSRIFICKKLQNLGTKFQSIFHHPLEYHHRAVYFSYNASSCSVVIHTSNCSDWWKFSIPIGYREMKPVLQFYLFSHMSAAAVGCHCPDTDTYTTDGRTPDSLSSSSLNIFLLSTSALHTVLLLSVSSSLRFSASCRCRHHLHRPLSPGVQLCGAVANINK